MAFLIPHADDGGGKLGVRATRKDIEDIKEICMGVRHETNFGEGQ